MNCVHSGSISVYKTLSLLTDLGELVLSELQRWTSWKSVAPQPEWNTVSCHIRPDPTTLGDTSHVPVCTSHIFFCMKSDLCPADALQHPLHILKNYTLTKKMMPGRRSMTWADEEPDWPLQDGAGTNMKDGGGGKENGSMPGCKQKEEKAEVEFKRFMFFSCTYKKY